MEKEQNTNSDKQNNDAEEIKAEELNIKTQTNTPENKEEVKEVTPEEKIKEARRQGCQSFCRNGKPKKKI